MTCPAQYLLESACVGNFQFLKKAYCGLRYMESYVKGGLVMSNQTRKMRPRSRQASERICTKQHNLTTYALVVAGAAGIYCFMTFGLGHIFGVI